MAGCPATPVPGLAGSRASACPSAGLPVSGHSGLILINTVMALYCFLTLLTIFMLLMLDFARSLIDDRELVFANLGISNSARVQCFVVIRN